MSTTSSEALAAVGLHEGEPVGGAQVGPVPDGWLPDHACHVPEPTRLYKT
ncbi:MAG: hypothetical protein WDA60_03050 [Acidimicrobiia bacterium]